MNLNPFVLACILSISIIGLVQATPLKPGLSKPKDRHHYANILQYYKLRAEKSEAPKDSASTEGDSVEVDIERRPSYRLEFTGGEPEMSPFASYQYEEKNVKNESTGSSVEVVVEVTTMFPPIENVTGIGKTEMVDESISNESVEDLCKEGELKKVECNTCVCSEGSFFCSKKNCTALMMNKGFGAGGLHYIIGEPMMSHEALAEKKEQMINSMNMMNNKSWKKKTQATTPLPDCSTGMTKAIDCNQCICAQQKWACTKRSCIALTFREKASYSDGSIIKKVDTLKENHNLDEDCLEDETRQLGCNHCVCHWNSWSCTNVTCTPTPAPASVPMVIPEVEEACQKEGDVKSKECNLCKCRRGVWVCTLNDCQKLGDKSEPPRQKLADKIEPPAFRSTSKLSKDKDI